MSTFTYKKVSYLTDPYQEYLMSKGKTEPSKDKYLSPNTITKTTKKERRTTKLLLDVNELGVLINIDNTKKNIPNSKKNGLLTPPGSLEDKGDYLNNYKSSTTTNNGLLTPPSSNSSLSLNDTSQDTIKTNKHSSFINPLLDMKFDVGGLFDDGDKNGDDIFQDIITKFDNMDDDVNMNSSVDYQNQKRFSQDTIKMKHISNMSTGTIKANNSIKASDTVKSSESIKDNDSIKASSTLKSSGTIKMEDDKHTSQDTIKLRENSVKKVDSFDNQLVQNLNENPAIVIDKSFLNDGDDDDYETNRGFDPDIYKDDEKIDFSETNNWDSPWGKDNNTKSPSSMKSSQSKLSAFSSFTIKSSKKLGKITKKFYKKITKQKESPQLPVSPLDIPESYNEKERAFEEMILRDDTISLSLSNPNGSLTSTFADKTFPLTEDANASENNNSFEMQNSLANRSFVSSVSSDDEDTYMKKKRHRNGINFEEALKEGNGFRISLANM